MAFFFLSWGIERFIYWSEVEAKPLRFCVARTTFLSYCWHESIGKVGAIRNIEFMYNNSLVLPKYRKRGTEGKLA